MPNIGCPIEGVKYIIGVPYYWPKMKDEKRIREVIAVLIEAKAYNQAKWLQWVLEE